MSSQLTNASQMFHRSSLQAMGNIDGLERDLREHSDTLGGHSEQRKRAQESNKNHGKT